MMVYTLGEKIRAKRKERKMTLKDLAGDRITPGQISLVESGKSNPSNDLLEYLAQRLNTKLDYFLESEESQARKLCEYYLNIAEISMYLGKREVCEAATQAGIKLSEDYRLQYYSGVLEFVRAQLMFQQNELEQAQQYAILANSIFLKDNNIEYSVKSFMLLGHISSEMGYLNTALNYFLQGESLMKENNIVSEILKAELYRNISLCHSRSNNNRKALEYAGLAMKRLTLLEDKESYAELLLERCLASEKADKSEDALNHSRQAKRLYSQVSEIHDVAEIETELGQIYAKAKHFTEAKVRFDNAVRLKSYINDTTLPMTMLKMGEAYNDNHECSQALTILQDMSGKITEGQQLYRIKCYEQLFNVHSKLGDTKSAEKVLLEGIEYMQSLDYKRNLGDFYSLLGKLYMETGNNELALNHISKGVDIYKELGIILNE